MDNRTWNGKRGGDRKRAREGFFHWLLKEFRVAGNKQESTRVCQQSRDQSHSNRHSRKTRPPVGRSQPLRIIHGFFGQRAVLGKEKKGNSKGQHE